MIFHHGCSRSAVRSIGSLAVLFTLLSILPSHARADGFEVGGRFGYAVAMGKAVAATTGYSNDLSDAIAGQVPLWLDLGYRFADRIFVGGYFQYGFGINGKTLDDGCSSSGSCSTHEFRLGAQVHVHALPGELADPWFGFGLGYEWMGFDMQGSNLQDANTDISGTLRGFEFANIQAGLDVQIAGGFSLGPFVSFSLGQYDSSSSDCSGSGCSSALTNSRDIPDKALHEWLLFGVRGVFAFSNKD